jgi:hypothetical protein
VLPCAASCLPLLSSVESRTLLFRRPAIRCRTARDAAVHPPRETKSNGHANDIDGVPHRRAWLTATSLATPHRPRPARRVQTTPGIPAGPDAPRRGPGDDGLPARTRQGPAAGDRSARLRCSLTRNVREGCVLTSQQRDAASRYRRALGFDLSPALCPRQPCARHHHHMLKRTSYEYFCPNSRTNVVQRSKRLLMPRRNWVTLR